MNTLEANFIVCAGHNQLYEIKNYLRKGININCQDEYGETGLMYSACNGHVAVVKYFLNQGADINLKSLSDMTAIMYACFSGSYETFKLLLKTNPKLDTTNWLGYNLFHCACAGGNVKIIKEVSNLKDKDGNKLFDIFSTTSKSINGLMIASKYGQAEAVDYLIQQGVNVKDRDKNKENAFDKVFNLESRKNSFNSNHAKVMKILSQHDIFDKVTPFEYKSFFRPCDKERS